jgi:thiol-disulfide isomerase/thioredoxin
MIRLIAAIVTLLLAWLSLLSAPASVGAQEPATDCASTFWLEAPEATPQPGARQIRDPSPAWLTTELTDACTGEVFTLADFAGKTLFIESMATWCGECYGQLTHVQDAASQIPEDERDDIVLVALSSEVGLPREDLARYAEETGFPLIFAVMPEDMLKAMVDDVGQAVAIPPAMPHLIVAPDGTIGELHTGGSSAEEELLALFTDAQAASTP